MGALVSVYREGTKELILSRVFPDSIDLRTANKLIGNYLEQEGFCNFCALERRTREANYSDYVLTDGRVLYGRVEGDVVLHVAKSDSLSYCDQAITGLFLSDIRYKETCDVCRRAAFL
jgi:hypothetical protein